jgi:integrase
LPYKPYRIALVPFARFCTGAGWEPENVSGAAFEAYQGYSDALGGRDPHASYRAACTAWNRAAAAFAHWPRFLVAGQDRRRHYSLPWSAFPASLRSEVDSMIAASLAPDPLSSRPVRPLRPTTARQRERAIRAFASALVHRGRQPVELTSIADLVAPNAARDGLRFMLQRTQQQRSAHLGEIARLLIILARHWVYPGDEHLDDTQRRAKIAHIKMLEDLRRRLKPHRSGMTEKNRTVLRHFAHDRIVSALLDLPKRVWGQRSRKRKLTRTELIRRQTALAVEILTVVPIRRQNLVSIRLDRNLVHGGTANDRRLHLCFAAHEVKNDVELEFELPRSTVDLIDRYLAEVRPHLPCCQSPFLFPGSAPGSHKCPYLLGNQIAKLTAQEVGVRITAHQFRHIAGYLYLMHNPGGHEVVRRLLGHKSIQTTIEFYAGMEQSAAFNHYHHMLAGRREDAESRPKRIGSSTHA